MTFKLAVYLSQTDRYPTSAPPLRVHQVPTVHIYKNIKSRRHHYVLDFVQIMHSQK